MKRQILAISAAFLAVLLPVAAAAQTFVRLQPVFKQDTLSANGDSTILTSTNVGGFGSVKIQTLDTYSGTWEVQCAVDGSTFDAAAELKMSAADGSTVVTSVTDAVGIWDVANAGGCRAIKVIATAGFAATDTVVVISATQAGGGGGGGSSGGGLTDTELRATAVSVTCGDCSGSGVTHIDDAAFTPAVSDLAPIGFVFDDSSPDPVDEGDAGTPRMSANRVPYSTIRDAAGNERGALVTANNELLVELGAGSAAIGTVTVTDGSGALNVIVDSGALTATVTDGAGALNVIVDSSATLTVTDGAGALNVICDSGCSGGTQYAEDAAHASGNTGTLGLAVRNDAGTALAADGDNIPLMVNSAGSLFVAGTVTVTDGSGALNVIVDSSAALTVGDGSGALNVICDSGCSGGTQYAEDAAHASGNTGTLALVVRNDAGTALAADGDNIPLMVNSAGALFVASHAVTNAGTFVTQVDGAALTALQLIDNIVGVEDAVAGSAFSGAPILAVRQDSHSDLAADGDFIPVTVDADGGLRVSIVAGAGSGGTALADDADFTAGTTSFTPAGGFYQSTVTACTDGDTCAVGITAGRALKVFVSAADGTAQTLASDMTVGTAYGTTGPGALFSYKDFDGSALPTTTNVNTEEEATPAAASIVGVQYIMAVNEDGSKSAFLAEDSAHASLDMGIQLLAVRQDTQANLGADGDYTPLSTNNVGDLRVTLGAGVAQIGNVSALTGSNIAHDGADSGNPHKIGGYASTTPPTAVTAADRVNAWYTLNGAAVTVPGGASAHYRTAAGSTEDEHEVKATAGVLYSVLVTNTNAAARYLRCYNLTAANTTPGTSTVFWGGAIPGNTAGAGFVYPFPAGLTFDTALTCALTTGAADSDVAEVAANEIKVTYSYR